MQIKALYICYFGIGEPLVETQVVAYMRELAKNGVEVSLLTFEPLRPSREEEKEIHARLSRQGIEWHWLKYHKRISPVATAWDIFRGVLFARRFIASRQPDILHGRVHVATLMGALARRLTRHRPKLLFDIRGFFPEEYVDGGVWPANGWLYRTAKRVETWLLKESDGFVVLTKKARDILFSAEHAKPVAVIPCCVEMERFASLNDDHRREMREKLGLNGRRVLVYVGSFGGWYLTDEMFEFLAAARAADPNVFVMVLTQRNTEAARAKARAAGIAEGDFLVTSVHPAELPAYLNAADAGVSFIKPSYSKQASSPTKIAEYLAAGLPIIANAGVGDVDVLITGHRVGVLIERFDEDAYLSALHELQGLGDVGERCRKTARDEFDLRSVGAERYLRLYQDLLQSGHGD